MDWYEILLSVPTEHTETATNIANMVVPYGVYIEDYSDLEQGAKEIAHIDLIDEELLCKDRNNAIIHIYFSNQDNLTEALGYLKERLATVNIPYDISTGERNESEWADNWKQFFKCTKIGERLLIRPSWEEYENTDGRVILNIDPGAAFGTGTHATTKLCLELLEKYVNPNSSILDIGCGSGILSIGGVLLGAKSAVGVDIDPLAVKVSAENAEINAVSEQIKFIEGNLAEKITGTFDVICANIVADIITDLSRHVKEFMEPHGFFICSGIIDIRSSEVEQALRSNGFKIIEQKDMENWKAYVAVQS